MDARQANLHYAQYCAKLGLFVFPCGADKKPLVKWRAVSTTNLEQIAQLWTERPDALPAIDLDKSGLVVVDGDRHGGPDGVIAVKQLFAEHQTPLDGVPGVITPRDGVHFYFRQPNGKPLGNSDKAVRDLAINIRGAGGYVIAPGAQLPDGRRYTRDKDTPNLFVALRDNALSPLPAWFVELLRPKTAHREEAPRPAHKLNGSDRHHAYAAAALDGVCESLASTAEGSRNIELNNAALRMGHMVVSGWIDRTTVERRLAVAAMSAGLPLDEIRGTLASGINAGMQEPQAELADRPLQKVRSEAKPPSSTGANDHQLNGPALLESVRADAIEMTAVEWIWPGRFAIGKLGIIAGLPDEGKGQILCNMAARITLGDQWPCEEGDAPQGNVILLTAEDDLSDTVVPRLAAAQADRTRIHIIKMVRHEDKLRMFSLVSDLELLRQKISEVGDVKMVQIDPISAYMGVGKIDSFRTTDVRAVLAPLVGLAAEMQVAIVGIMHFNKKIDINNALLRISDSLAYGATARHVYAAVNDAEHQRKLFVRAKNNLAISADKALAYRFTACEVGADPKSGKTIRAPYIVWDHQYVDVTATEAMQAAADTRSPAARDDAKKFLTDFLADGPMLKTDIEEAAKANGISERTLFRAKGELKITAKRDGANGGWRWHPPKQDPIGKWFGDD